MMALHNEMVGERCNNEKLEMTRKEFGNLPSGLNGDNSEE